ncbi:MAG: S8 family serine peptidase, partial [Nitrososphaera sp.]
VSTYRGKVRHTFKDAIKGFAAEMSEAEAIRLSQDPRVDFVEEDGVMYADAATTQNTTAATWGLDRIDQRNLPLNNLYSYRGSGFGVNAYVIDSGIRATHQEFAGRVAAVRDFVGGQRQ